MVHPAGVAHAVLDSDPTPPRATLAKCSGFYTVCPGAADQLCWKVSAGG